MSQRNISLILDLALLREMCLAAIYPLRSLDLLCCLFNLCASHKGSEALPAYAGRQVNNNAREKQTPSSSETWRACTQMREGAMEVFSYAYRSLSCAAAQQLLLLPAGGLAPERDLAALLKACTDRGSGCAARALSTLQTAEPSAPQMLVFRS